MKRLFTFLMFAMALSLYTPQLCMAQNTKDAVEEARKKAHSAAEQVKEQNEKRRAENAESNAFYEEQGKRDTNFSYIIIALIAVGGGIFVWYKFGRMIGSIVRIIRGKYRLKTDLRSLDAKKILIAAIYSDQQGAYLDILKTDIGSSRLYTILSEWWGINGRDSALETLDYLQHKGFAYYLPTVLKAFEAGSDEERKAIIIEAMTDQEDAEKAYDQTQNLLESVGILKDKGWIKHQDDVERYGVFGWDVGRLVFVARLCYEAKYISGQEAWDYIDAAYEQAQRTFNSWEELARSYVIGRFIWKGREANDGVDDTARDLVEKPNSPWQQIQWK